MLELLASWQHSGRQHSGRVHQTSSGEWLLQRDVMVRHAHGACAELQQFLVQDCRKAIMVTDLLQASCWSLRPQGAPKSTSLECPVLSCS